MLQEIIHYRRHEYIKNSGSEPKYLILGYLLNLTLKAEIAAKYGGPVGECLTQYEGMTIIETKTEIIDFGR